MKGHWIAYNAVELAWLEANRLLPINEYASAFNAAFKRDVAPSNLHALRKRNGWKTGRTGCFAKGNEPINKGVPCPPGVGARHPNAVKTQFKKGHGRSGCAVDLYKPIGSERQSKDGYLERKIHDGLPLQSRWRAVHLIEWESVNGPIPKGFCLKSLDGDRNNTAPANWLLIERALLPMLNGGRHKTRPAYDEAAPEIRPALLALAKVQTKARALRKQSAARRPPFQPSAAPGDRLADDRSARAEPSSKDSDMTNPLDLEALDKAAKAATLEQLSPEAYNALLDPFMEIAQAIHDEAYTNGFADAKYDSADEEYDRDALTETLDGECRRDSFYEGLEHDARTKFEGIVATQAARLQAAESEVERLNAACREQFEAATHNAKACNELTAKVEQQKRRADNHWESLRSIREFAREGDCERIIQWVNDSGSGYVETAEQTLGVWIDKATTAEDLVKRLRDELNNADNDIAALKHENAAQAETIGELCAALHPFALEAMEWSATVSSDFVPECSEDGATGSPAKFTIGDLRRAASSYADALSKARPDTGEQTDA